MHTSSTPTCRRWHWLVVTAVFMVTAAACGSDDSSEPALGIGESTTSERSPTTEPPSSTSVPPSTTSTTSPLEPAGAPPACEIYFDISAALGTGGDPSSVPSLLDDLEAVLPTEVEAELRVMMASARQVLDSGGSDFAPFGTPEFRDASATSDQWMFDNCVFETASVVDAADYSYSGVEGNYPAGLTAFHVTNTGEEVHELVVVRRNDGVTESWDDLLALPEEEALSKVQPMGSAFIDRPGSATLLTVDLTPGDYIAVCFIAVGTQVSEDGTFVEGDGPPHFDVGMRTEFAVS